MKQFHDEKYGNILIYRENEIKNFKPVAHYNVNFGFYQSKYVGLPHLMEHIICRYAAEQNQSNAYTSTGHMSFICRSVKNLKAMMRQIYNINFIDVPDKLIKQEIQRVSSEYNYRTFNMNMSGFFQQYNQSQCIDSKHMGNLIIGNVQYYEDISGGDVSKLKQMMQDLKKNYFIKDNSYCYLVISQSQSLEELFGDLGIKNPGEMKEHKFDMLTYPFQIVDEEYNPNVCQNNCSMIVNRTNKQLSQFMIKIKNPSNMTQHQYLKTFKNILYYTWIDSKVIRFLDDDKVSQNFNYSQQGPFIYILITFEYPQWYTSDQIIDSCGIILSKIQKMANVSNEYKQRIKDDMGNGSKILIQNMKDEYVSVLFDSLKYLSNMKIQDSLDLMMQTPDISYNIFDHISDVQTLIYTDNKPRLHTIGKNNKNIYHFQLHPIENTIIMKELINAQIMEQFIYYNQNVYVYFNNKIKDMLYKIQYIQQKYEKIQENTELNTEDLGVIENPGSLLYDKLEYGLDFESHLHQYNDDYIKQKMLIDKIKKKYKKDPKTHKLIKKIQKESKLKTQHDKHFNYKCVFQNTMILQKTKKNYAYSLQDFKQSSQYPAQIISFSLIKGSMDILQFDRLKQIIRAFYSNNFLNTLFQAVYILIPKKDIITIQLYSIYTPMINTAEQIIRSLSVVNQLLQQKYDRDSHIMNVLYDFDNIVASIDNDQIDLDNIYTREMNKGLESLYYVIDISTCQNDMYMQDIEKEVQNHSFFTENRLQMDQQDIQFLQQQIDQGLIYDSSGGGGQKPRVHYPLKIQIKDYNFNCQKLSVYYIIDDALKNTVKLVMDKLDEMQLDTSKYEHRIYSQFIKTLYDNLSEVDNHIYQKFDHFIYSLSVNVINCINNKYCIKIQYLLPENIKINDMIDKHQNMIQETDWSRVFQDKTFIRYFQLYVQQNKKVIYLIQQSSDVIERLQEEITDVLTIDQLLGIKN